jgi:hypothetical protein
MTSDTIPDVLIDERDDGVTLIVPAPGSFAVDISALFPTAIPFRRADLPDVSWRDAWRLVDGGVAIDLEAARGVWRYRIRAARAALWPANDLAIRDALIDGDVAALTAARARRDDLRNAPQDPAIDAAASLEELAAVWPSCLGAKS